MTSESHLAVLFSPDPVSLQLKAYATHTKTTKAISTYRSTNLPPPLPNLRSFPPNGQKRTSDTRTTFHPSLLRQQVIRRARVPRIHDVDPYAQLSHQVVLRLRRQHPQFTARAENQQVRFWMQHGEQAERLLWNCEDAAARIEEGGNLA